MLLFQWKVMKDSVNVLRGKLKGSEVKTSTLVHHCCFVVPLGGTLLEMDTKALPKGGVTPS